MNFILRNERKQKILNQSNEEFLVSNKNLKLDVIFTVYNSAVEHR